MSGSLTQIGEASNFVSHCFREKNSAFSTIPSGSVKTNENEIKFIVTDYTNEIIVSYQGTVPVLFAEGKGVVAEGKLQDKKFFLARRILAKHDENYMPPKNKENIEKNAK